MNTTTRILKKPVLLGSALLLLILTLLWMLYHATPTYEYGIKGQQYVTTNLPKNWGVRETILEAADSFLAWRPQPAEAEFERAQSPAGASDNPASNRLQLPPADDILSVDSPQALLKALKNATAGQLILLAPGEYPISQRTIRVGHGGEPAFPITLAARQLGQVEIQLDSLEGLYLNKPHWVIKNLTFRGTCQRDSACEHALHLTGNGDNILIENNRFIDFNGHLKSNGRVIKDQREFPDQVTIRHNDFYNTRIREGRNPASPIDVVGGNDWLIADNFIADFSRKVRGKVSVVYGAYLKGGGENGVFRNNVVNCAWRLPHQSALDVRVGLSLGNGGTGKSFCQAPDCVYEHKGGLIESNLLLNCSNDVAIYLSKAADTRVIDNIILNSLGIDARFSASTVTLENNRLHGRIKARDGATIESRNNHFLHLRDNF